MAGDAGAPTGGDAAQQGGEQQAQQQAPAFDPAQVNSTLEGLGSDMGELRQLVQQLVPSQEDAQQDQEELAPLDLTALQLDPYAGEQEQQAQVQQLQSLIQQQIDAGIQRGLQEHVDPLRQETQQIREGLEIQALVEEFPFFENNPEAAGQMVGTARDIAQSQNWGPEVGQNATFWRLVTMASLYADAVNNEQQQDATGSAPGAQLEGAGSAGLPGFGPDAARGIVEAGGHRGSSVLPF